uniref:Uncharacterized protein n=1 Tax=Rangifer tarandus platyrhynchus TaxID=3082113 RepID=A0ACB0FMC7_RANTA|nr:unnamed protein product [Rangifer tarandus platyrhynchus]
MGVHNVNPRYTPARGVRMGHDAHFLLRSSEAVQGRGGARVAPQSAAEGLPGKGGVTGNAGGRVRKGRAAAGPPPRGPSFR